MCELLKIKKKKIRDMVDNKYANFFSTLEVDLSSRNLDT